MLKRITNFISNHPFLTIIIVTILLIASTVIAFMLGKMWVALFGGAAAISAVGLSALETDQADIENNIKGMDNEENTINNNDNYDISTDKYNSSTKN